MSICCSYKIMTFLRLVKEHADVSKADTGKEETDDRDEATDGQGEAVVASEGINFDKDASSRNSNNPVEGVVFSSESVPRFPIDSVDADYVQKDGGEPSGNSDEGEESSNAAGKDLMAPSQCSTAYQPELSLLKPRPLNTAGVMSGRGGLSSVTSTTKPLLEDMADDGETTVVRDDLCLVDALAQSEKEVTPTEGPGGIPDKEHSAQDQNLEIPQAEGKIIIVVVVVVVTIVII